MRERTTRRRTTAQGILLVLGLLIGPRLVSADPPLQGPLLKRPPASRPSLPPLPTLDREPIRPPLMPAAEPRPRPDESEPPQVPALTEKTLGPLLEDTEAWSKIVTAIAREAVPDKYEDRSHWGKTKEVFGGLDIEPRPGRIAPKISKHKIRVRHGFWRKYRIDLIKPEETFNVAIRNIKVKQPGQFDFNVRVTIRLRVSSRVESWVRGVKGFNMEVVSDATVVVVILSSLAVTSDLPPGQLIPDIVLLPEVRGIKLYLTDLDTRKIGVIGRDLANELGDGSRKFIEKLLQKQEKKLLAKARKEIEKHRDQLRLASPRFFGDEKQTETPPEQPRSPMTSRNRLDAESPPSLQSRP